LASIFYYTGNDMLQLSNILMNRPVLSLRTGGIIGQTLQPVINPNNLKIEGFYCDDKFNKKTSILLSQEIRDFITQGIVVNDQEALTDPDELVRLKDVLALNFELLGKPVVTISKQRVGKVTDFALDTETMYVQKLYVGRSLLKSLNSGQLSVDRTQIIEITNKKIVVQEILKPKKSAIPATAPITP
jgi:sporulation protein YlmC with PRC-barrel domain